MLMPKKVKFRKQQRGREEEYRERAPRRPQARAWNWWL